MSAIAILDKKIALIDRGRQALAEAKEIRRGVARPGLAWPGAARQGVFQHPGEAWRGEAWRGTAWHGAARRGKEFFTKGTVMATKTKHNNRISADTNGEDNGGGLDAPATMKPEIVAFRIVGISPLLQNNPANFIGKTEEQGLGAKKTYDDAEEAELRVYRNDEGYYHPAKAFIKAMVRAVTGKKFGKVNAPNLIKGSVFLAEPHCLILGADGKPAEKYGIDRQPCVVGKARILRCRPCWSKWLMNLALEIDASLISRSSIKDALGLAGRTVGIGDYRPEKGGGYGRFKVE